MLGPGVLTNQNAGTYKGLGYNPSDKNVLPTDWL